MKLIETQFEKKFKYFEIRFDWLSRLIFTDRFFKEWSTADYANTAAATNSVWDRVENAENWQC